MRRGHVAALVAALLGSLAFLVVPAAAAEGLVGARKRERPERRIARRPAYEGAWVAFAAHADDSSARTDRRVQCRLQRCLKIRCIVTACGSVERDAGIVENRNPRRI